ncbi:MAG: peptide chain release factor 2 [Firmicutes bacterium]|nr:peptide chain release factor 2 [Bacillota bacterium]
MLDLILQKQNLAKTQEVLEGCCKAVDLDGLRKKRVELETAINAEGFFNDTKKAAMVTTEMSKVSKKIERCENFAKRVADCFEMMELLKMEYDEGVASELQTEIALLGESIESLHTETMLRGEYDGNNAIISLHAGAGGTEAQDWAAMLYRMYKMYCDKKGYTTKELDYIVGDEAGIKGVTFLVSGENAYGYLSAEKGVHRLVRISPFDSNARRHTSFASMEVMPEIQNDTAIEIRQEDLKVDTYRSGGAGGQHVNKTESAIRITHIPTGIIVACQNERSQIQNRETAMGMLRAKLVEKRERERLEKAQNIQGALKKIEWGSQIRSYVFAPYTMVKDHRTNFENANVHAVMDGDLHPFIVDYLQKKSAVSG